PRPDASAAAPTTVGGLARMATVIERLRRERKGRTLLVNVGDAVQGSAEALFTSGRAIVDIFALLHVDAYIPGNWDYVYGIDRFVETFVGAKGKQPLAPWTTVASNLYYSTPDAGMRSAYVDVTGERVLPSYVVRDVGGVRVGIVGITTTRGPRALGSESTRGFTFTAGEAELAGLIARLRGQERVQVVVVASELELANNIRIAERTRGIDVVLSADMHELTREPIVTAGGTVIVEEGQDGVAVGELTLSVNGGKVAKWTWSLHDVTDTISADAAVARAVERARAPLLAGAAFDRRLLNPINGAIIAGPIDQVLGYTKVALHRANPASRETPAVLEGSSHDMLADAFRSVTGADVALVRGFRYGTHVRPGPITREDLYHYLPIGAQVAIVDSVPGRVIWHQLESSLQGAIDPDPAMWTGGWLVAMSGLRIDVDPYAKTGERIRSASVNGAPLDTTGARRYSVAGLWFQSEPNAVSNCVPCVSSGARLRVIPARDGTREDAVEIVAAYLASQPDSAVSPALGRVRLVRPLPGSSYRFPEIQPLHGAGSVGKHASPAGQMTPPARH
ncbi:MAG TPA: bifunctional metallophosphatase/5'-nucleotidase, partial [Gemmatimonadaceae bacterium]|nr:bifunctional metallophosphatase/5'-nucleotidase [Gemmatimonadaceae bacterium]